MIDFEIDGSRRELAARFAGLVRGRSGHLQQVFAVLAHDYVGGAHVGAEGLHVLLVACRLLLQGVTYRLFGVCSQRHWICVLLALQRPQEHVGHVSLAGAKLLLNLLLELDQLLLNLGVDVAALVARLQFQLVLETRERWRVAIGQSRLRSVKVVIIAKVFRIVIVMLMTFLLVCERRNGRIVRVHVGAAEFLTSLLPCNHLAELLHLGRDR